MRSLLLYYIITIVSIVDLFGCLLNKLVNVESAMVKKCVIITVFSLNSYLSRSQMSLHKAIDDTTKVNYTSKQFIFTSEYLDAAINSINSFNSLIKKENYRNKITSLNNPTSSDMGFNLENEVQSALKPLLAKAKNTNTDKFSQVISSLFTAPAKTGVTTGKTVASTINPLFGTLLVWWVHSPYRKRK